jgi:preprotein translocase subunit SecG
MDLFPIVLTIHLLLALGLVGVVLLQRSEGGALGIGGGGGSGGGVLTGRAAGNLLTRTTAILGASFFATSLLLAIIANSHTNATATPFDKLPAQAPAQAFPPAPQSSPAQPAAPLGN